MSSLPIGTVFYSRNLREADNKTPGVANHLAILVDENTVVESQEKMDGKSGVMLTPLTEYKSRNYQWGALYPVNKETGRKAAEVARSLVGKKYGKLTSIRPHLSDNPHRMNCVSVINVSYSKALGTDIKMAIPDDIFKYGKIFTDRLA